MRKGENKAKQTKKTPRGSQEEGSTETEEQEAEQSKHMTGEKNM